MLLFPYNLSFCKHFTVSNQGTDRLDRLKEKKKADQHGLTRNKIADYLTLKPVNT